jgi:RES domain
MSLHIWTPDALSSELRSYEGDCWRLVEAQHQVSTLNLVDTLAEQAVLEDLIEMTKPSIPIECRHLDYLLATPFRYGSAYPHGSRFRRAGMTAGVFYASETVETAVAEMAFYRLLFFAESPLTPWPADASELTAFSVSVVTMKLIDLTIKPLNEDQGVWTSIDTYDACQSLAETTRLAGGEIIRYFSVRDPQKGLNVAVLTCGAFAEPRPKSRQTWRLRLSASGVQAICEFPRNALEFGHEVFAADPRIMNFNWDRK